VKKSALSLLIASKEGDVKINTGKPERTLPCREQNVVHNRNLKMGNKSFENVAKFYYLGTTLTKEKLHA
jgi:hypothetical protein